MSSPGDLPGTGSNSSLYAAVAVLFTVFAVIGGLVFKLFYDERQAAARTAEAEALLAEGQRRPTNRTRNVEPEEVDDDDEEAYEDDDETFKGKKIGTKKLAKLQAKEEAKKAREYEQRLREDRKQKEAEEDRLREEAKKKENEEEQKRLETEKAERQERERRELEEYLKLKQSFVVEEEGNDAKTEDEKQNMLKTFVDHIIKTKVIHLDELASQFELDVESAVGKINFFLEQGILSGVFDDRGKFIYISEDELAAVAKFINQRGRISLHDLADYSNQLISFESKSAET